MKQTIAIITAIALTAILLTACAQAPVDSADPDAENALSGSAVPASAVEDDAEKDAENDTPEAPQDSDEAEDAAAQPDEPEEPEASDDSISLADPVPVPDAARQPAAEPEPAPAPADAPAPAYGAIPFSVAAGTDKWWVIDSTDDAYWAMQEQINAVRAAGGLPALTMDSNLSATASSRCESFVAGGPFDHSGMVTLSEICAMGPLGSASAACAAWVASEGHYAQIMRTDISTMGVGCWFCDYEGNQFTYWVVTFG